MTRASKREYIEALRERYRLARKREKGRLLSEAVVVTGYHRKALIRMLGYGDERPAPRRRGRRPRYGAEAVVGLVELWETADRICARRLHPFVPELLVVLGRHGRRFSPQVEGELRAMSASTMERRLRALRGRGHKRAYTVTRPGSLLKKSIPIRTFAEWEEGRPGFLEVDLVAHCGESVEGLHLTTLTGVDIASGWTACAGVWGKSYHEVGSAIHHLLEGMPFTVQGLDTDNGGEFINEQLVSYCRRRRITFTRSRPYKKNDSAHVEQKNGYVVRRYVGYDRYESREALMALRRLYEAVGLYTNYFQPVMQLRHKSRQGAKVHKVYDRAQTPYQRLMASGQLTRAQQERLALAYHGLDPRRLLASIHLRQQELWRLAALPRHQRRLR
jgi:acyl-CoA thioesterase FadM